MGLIEVTNLHYRDLVEGFLDHKTVEEAFSYISRDSTLSDAYLDRLKSIYASPTYHDWSEVHPLREKQLKKEIIDAWVGEWRRMNRSEPPERSIVEEIISQLPGLTESGLRAIQHEIAVALSVRENQQERRNGGRG
ncbi:MAG: hypothetical protein WBX20_19435 [Terrimicrobiaceae bacterium]